MNQADDFVFVFFFSLVRDEQEQIEKVKQGQEERCCCWKQALCFDKLTVLSILSELFPQCWRHRSMVMVQWLPQLKVIKVLLNKHGIFISYQVHLPSKTVLQDVKEDRILQFCCKHSFGLVFFVCLLDFFLGFVISFWFGLWLVGFLFPKEIQLKAYPNKGFLTGSPVPNYFLGFWWLCLKKRVNCCFRTAGVCSWHLWSQYLLHVFILWFYLYFST